jgi:hypothetical protein
VTAEDADEIQGESEKTLTSTLIQSDIHSSSLTLETRIRKKKTTSKLFQPI